MMEKLKNITPAEFRCVISVSCPAVFKSEDGKTYVIIGEFRNDVLMDQPVGETESVVEISADLLEASLGLHDLMEAAEPLANRLASLEKSLSPVNMSVSDDEACFVKAGDIRALSAALHRAKGGDATK